MTPHEFLRIQQLEEDGINCAQRRIASARVQANQCPTPPMSNLRPALAEDVVVGAILWYPPTKYSGRRPPFWSIVDEPLYYGDAFKAYVADDGCRYGLDGAYVEKDGTLKCRNVQAKEG